jgi:hypothetical protein
MTIETRALMAVLALGVLAGGAGSQEIDLISYGREVYGDPLSAWVAVISFPAGEAGGAPPPEAEALGATIVQAALSPQGSLWRMALTFEAAWQDPQKPPPLRIRRSGASTLYYPATAEALFRPGPSPRTSSSPAPERIEYSVRFDRPAVRAGALAYLILEARGPGEALAGLDALRPESLRGGNLEGRPLRAYSEGGAAGSAGLRLSYPIRADRESTTLEANFNGEKVTIPVLAAAGASPAVAAPVRDRNGTARLLLFLAAGICAAVGAGTAGVALIRRVKAGVRRDGCAEARAESPRGQGSLVVAALTFLGLGVLAALFASFMPGEGDIEARPGLLLYVMPDAASASCALEGGEGRGVIAVRVRGLDGDEWVLLRYADGTQGWTRAEALISPGR